MSDPTILLVHGAWHGAWCWDAVIPLLEAKGRTVHAIDLPTVHAPNKAELGLADDAQAVTDAAAAIDGPVVVVAHSYGGVPTTQALAGAENVVHIVYIAAFALDAGESLLGAVGGEAPSWWMVDGPLTTAGNDAEPAESLFFNDLPADVASANVARLQSQATKPFGEAITEVAWKTIPSTYLITEQDVIFPLFAQEALSGRAGSTVHRLDTGHSPFLSQPEATAAIIDAAGR
ncbi:alpha/beta hydrolase [Pseudolysinimonas sp.]|jgi:pimeloyl-ACP methyl ester carboxylesterase|uniref:alpha/beta hydrolase n=1 Tax=Pseudolysinimonas sp. TaxID=2680009 RepID=UPI003784D906